MFDLKLLDKEFAKRGSLPLATLNIGLSLVACCMVIWGNSVEAAISIVSVLAILNGGTTIMDKSMKKKLIEKIETLGGEKEKEK